MKKIGILFIATLLIVNITVNGQTIQKPDSLSNVEKAQYLKEDLNKFLAQNAKYPREGLSKNVQGDVVISFLINRNGQLRNLTISSSPDISLSASSLDALNSVNGEWSPAKINDRPIDRKYFIIFRYRIYIDTQPIDYKSPAKRYFTKQKYEKALKRYDNAIKENQYDYELFEARSKIKEILGDIDGSKQDARTSYSLKNEVMTVINVTVIGVKRAVQISSEVVQIRR